MIITAKSLTLDLLTICLQTQFGDIVADYGHTDAMRLAPRLKFPRPCAWKPLGTRNPASLRFYNVARQQELVKANALNYPRIRHDVTPMRIPEFQEKYQDTQQGTVADEEVVVRGRVQFVRTASSKLIFIVIKSEFEQIQGMLNFRNLELAGTTAGVFKEFSKLVARGDIICTCCHTLSDCWTGANIQQP